MRWLRNVLLGLAGLGLLLYALALGVYSVASTAPQVDSQPVDAAAARAVIRELGLTEAYPFEHGFVRTPHGRMHYASQGTGDTVLCLHGNPTWSFLYRDFLTGLSDRTRVVAPDLIGFGLSQKLAEPADYSIEGHVDDVSALVESLDLQRITLVMQDWGGPIGLGVALRHPERIRALVVMNTVGFRPPGDGIPLPFRMLRIPVLGEQLVQGLGLFHRAFVPLGIARDERRQRNVLAAYEGVQDTWDDRAGALAFPRLIPVDPEDPTAELLQQTDQYLQEFSGPVLILWGMRDPVFSKGVLEEWRQRFPAAPVVEVEDAGHFLQEDAAERIVPRIRQFLSNGVQL